MFRKEQAWIILVCWLALPLAWAQGMTYHTLGVDIPDEIQIGDPSEKLVLNGYASLKQWGDNLYVGALFTSKYEAQSEKLLLEDQPMVMFIYFVQDNIDPSLFVDRWVERMVVNNTSIDKQIEGKWAKELRATFKEPLHAGDIVAIQYVPESGLSIILNGTEIKKWQHAKSFFNMILRTWIGPYPPSRDFKQKMLNLQKATVVTS